MPPKKKPVPTDEQPAPEPAPAVEAAPVVENAPLVESAPAIETAPLVEPAPATETAPEWTPEDRVAALADAAGLRGVSPDQVDVAAARVLNRG